MNITETWREIEREILLPWKMVRWLDCNAGAHALPCQPKTW